MRDSAQFDGWAAGAFRPNAQNWYACAGGCGVPRSGALAKGHSSWGRACAILVQLLPGDYKTVVLCLTIPFLEEQNAG